MVTIRMNINNRNFKSIKKSMKIEIDDLAKRENIFPRIYKLPYFMYVIAI